ncbi:olfactory receptor-like protein OLF4 [Erpetoichthys calabaricus]|uniref:Olfactory receptor-like protein OLF4 n=1 Tax=Erpetoichthys calabaricus TaxID=27687 RepID=A0A8C4RT64_ERPCA|nr:olfactory receptor-like protein OLF4 [Erpetoichthys calabaricus]
MQDTARSNETHVRPAGFFIGGFTDLPYESYFWGFLSIVYFLTLKSNALIILIIWCNQSLHTPKYLAICHMAVIDTCCSTAVIPKAIDTFLLNHRFVKYEACMCSVFFVHFYVGMQSFSLMLLAYDRFIAICFPLHQHTINTPFRMLLIIVILWLIMAALTLILVGLISNLSFCSSLVVKSYFCDHGPVIYLACNDNSLNIEMANLHIIVALFVPLCFILFTYACIFRALSKLSSVDSQKAFKTCTSHLILVGIYYTPLLLTYFTVMAGYSISTNARILNSSLSVSVPPMLNPIIYTLKTEEIMDKIRKYLFQRQLASSSG